VVLHPLRTGGWPAPSGGMGCLWVISGRTAVGMHGATGPVLFLVDEDREALEALRRALERRLGADYRIIAETKPEDGLSVLSQLRERDEPVAVIIAAQPMQFMTGEHFIELAHELHPLAGRALIGDAFDRRVEESISRAMALGRADMILARPWDPADHRLYPRIGMLLDRWVQATEQPGVWALRIVMEPDAPHAHELRDELYRNAVPFQCFPPDSPQGRSCSNWRAGMRHGCRCACTSTGAFRSILRSRRSRRRWGYDAGLIFATTPSR
jgi:thioredoxin reductase (NADPH)